MLTTEPQAPIEATPAHRVDNINLSVLPIMVLGFLIVIFSLANVPWLPDYVDAPFWDRVSHWERTTGNDLPDDPNTEFQRPPGYEARRVLDWAVYFSIAFGSLTILLLGFLNQRWLFINLVFVGFYGIAYSATSGVVAGAAVCSFGYGLVLVSAVFGWLTSGSDSQTYFHENQSLVEV